MLALFFIAHTYTGSPARFSSDLPSVRLSAFFPDESCVVVSMTTEDDLLNDDSSEEKEVFSLTVVADDETVPVVATAVDADGVLAVAVVWRAGFDGEDAVVVAEVVCVDGVLIMCVIRNGEVDGIGTGLVTRPVTDEAVFNVGRKDDVDGEGDVLVRVDDADGVVV